MRIAVTTWSSRRVGGVETYLGQVIPALAQGGHELALFHETEVPAAAEPMLPPGAFPTYCAEKVGRGDVMRALAEWEPDVVYAHGAHDPQFDLDAGRVAPSIFFVHNYHGTCIGGMKTFRRPVPMPCDRLFGWGCFLQYYPRRCGGLNPITMISRYLEQSKRLRAVVSCAAVVTHSHHMYCEFAKHGVPVERLHRFPFYAAGQERGADRGTGRSLPVLAPDEAERYVPRSAEGAWRILFSGRFDQLKGGGLLLEALPSVSARLGAPVEVTMAGDGPARAEWEALADRVRRQSASVRIRFTGWVGKAEIGQLLRGNDLVVVPSVWPEPFGLVGPEAGLQGVPAVAFAVGGVRDWLSDGVNGYLAPGNPPTGAGLADAMVRCLSDNAGYAKLRRGAVDLARRFNREDHLRRLINVFEGVRRSR
jgi:glycosyltransferase involved in cell wall biosynthesis